MDMKITPKDQHKERARQSGNSEGLVMGGINLAMFPAELIPPEIRFSCEARYQVEKAARERAGSSTEKCAEQASSEDHFPTP